MKAGATSAHASAWRRALIAGLIGVVGGSTPLGGQSSPTLALRVLTDTGSARISGVVIGGAALAGTALHASIRPIAGGAPIYEGVLGTLVADGNDARLPERTVRVRARVWSPAAPTLYELRITSDAGDRLTVLPMRMGFRTVSTRGGKILLNGRPVFLRGHAINPPGRNLPDSLSNSPRFAREYLRFMKQAGVNLVRMGSPSAIWFDAADEVGMLVMQGNYGTPRGGSATRAPADRAASLAWYKRDVLGPQENHPSVVIYALTNEVADRDVHYLSDGADEMARFLQATYDSLRAWDPTRLYLANAGYGYGRTGDLCDLHRYWGWYYNSFLSFYTLRDPSTCWHVRTGLPITLSETTGNYTGGDGRFNLVSDTKQPDSQLNWTGHAPPAEQASRALAYQAWMAGQAIEITRRLRERNAALAGLSPFTIAFGEWFGATSVESMRPKPVVAQYARSFSPVLLSWESWRPQVYAGTALTPVVHVVNDRDDGGALPASTLVYELRDATGARSLTGRMSFPAVPYYGAVHRALSIALPATLAAGTYTLRGALVAGRDTISRNEMQFRVFTRPPVASQSLVRRVVLYGASTGRTGDALRRLGVPTARVARLSELDPARDALVVGAGEWDAALNGQVGSLGRFIERGGRALVLDQAPDRFDTHWLPGGVRLSVTALDHADVMPGGRPWAQGMAVNPERPSHLVFDGISRDDLFLWSDYTNWNEAKPGFPAVYPVTRGFSFTRTEQLGRVAVLANYDHGLLGVALAEFFTGRGSTVLSAFDIIPRVGLDPVADRLLLNLVRYVGGDVAHAPHPLIADRVVWGDYGSERGLVTGVYNGLLVNTVPTMPDALRAKYPVKIDADGFWIAGDAGGWNTRPAVQYVPRGRRPFGPFEFSSGGAYVLPEGHGPEGEGRFYMEVPTGRSRLTHVIENPTADSLDVEVAVNGRVDTRRIPPRETVRVTQSFPAGATQLAVRLRGDRRLILLETDVLP